MKITGAHVLTLLMLLLGTSTIIWANASEADVCDEAVLQLVPCSDSILGEGSVTPNDECCVALRELMLTPDCLCFAATNAQGFDKREVLGLPHACRLPVKSGQTCDGLPIPN